MKFIKKSTLRNDVSQIIRDLIYNNELKPGERIVETKLAKELGVSQSPVREAIRELEMMGLIENKPFSGCFVKKLTKKDISDAYKVRAYLEMLAVKEAIGNLTKDNLEDMDELLKKMRAAADNHLVKEFIELDIAFHKLIVDLADNSLLARMWNTIHLGHWTFITARFSKKSLTELATRHEDLFESLKNRACENASECIKNHIEELSEEILIRLDSSSN